MAELEAKIIAEITCIRPETSVATAPPAPVEAGPEAETKADTNAGSAAAVRQAPATWVTAAARAAKEWVRPLAARAAAAAQSKPAV